MKKNRIHLFARIACVLSAISLPAQQTPSSNTAPDWATAAIIQPPSNGGLIAGSVPRLLQFSGVVHPAAITSDVVPTPTSNNGATITFSLYEFQEGGAPLWSETQSVQIDKQGRYTVLLGVTQPTGLPLDLFASGKAVWLGVQGEATGAIDKGRVLLVAVPYALKAADADTLGGLPPSAFLQAGVATVAPALVTGSNARIDSPVGVIPDAACASLTSDGTGTSNQIAKFSAPCNLEPSAIFESGGKVGIGTTAPSASLDVKGTATIVGALTMSSKGAATSSAGTGSYPIDLMASSYDGALSTPITQHFRWQAEPSGNDTSNPGGSLNLLYASGTGTPAETGLSVNNKGLFTFVAGQTFPGAGGGITGVTAGTDLTGGGTSGNVTLNLDVTKVPQLNAPNTFTANQTVSGTVAATSFAGNGSALTNLQGSNVQGTVASAANALDLGGLPPSAYQPAGSYATTGSNTFNGNQSVTGNVAATGSISGGSATFTGLVTAAGALFPATGTATAAQGYSSQPLDAVTSAYNSSKASAQSQDFRWLAEPVGNDTGSPSARLDLLFGANGATPTETGLSVASNGLITFASGQTFGPGGGGTVTSVGSGAGLTGGPITSSGTLSIATGGVTNAMLANSSFTVLPGMDLTGGGSVALGSSTTLNLDTTKVPQLNAPNAFTANQTVNGTVAATSFAGNGSALTNLQGSNVQGTVASAANALDLGGLPPSAYQPAGSYATTSSNTFNGNQSITGNVAASGSVSGGSATFTGLVTAAGALLPATGTATTAQGYNSQPLDSVTSVYNSSAASAQSQNFRWLAEPVGNDTGSPSARLDLLFAANGATPTETGLSVASNGLITFAAGQTFGAGGGGTVTSVGSGAGLTGGPITSTGTLSIAAGGVTNAMLANSSLTILPGTDLTGGGPVALGGSTTLNLDTTKVPQLNASNTFGTGQTVNGSVTGTQFISTVASGSAPLVVSSTTQVNNLNATFVGGLPAASFQPAGAYATLSSNTFSATQLVSSGDVSIAGGNLDLPQTSNSGLGLINMNGAPFIHACCGSAGNIFVGLAAGLVTAANTGGQNVGVGVGALASNSTGQTNTAVGSGAMQSNTSGSYNTAVGWEALSENGSQGNNTAIGANTLDNNTSGFDNTATGRLALAANTTGADNTAVGEYALATNTTGQQNTALGQNTGSNNVTGSYNTFIGMNAGPNQDGIQFSTAIGYAASVSQSNSMVLGGLFGNSVRVGIGTTAPSASLHVNNVISAPNLLLGQFNGTNEFRIDNTGKGFFDGGTQTSGADFAESVAVRGRKSLYEPGDLLAIDTAGRRRLALADKPYSTRVAGIYSTKPGVLATPHKMDDPAAGEEVPLAVVGIVPCKVTAANGAIEVGDLLVASPLPGYAMKGRDRYRLVGAVVGKALEPLKQGRGVIQVLVTLQ